MHKTFFLLCCFLVAQNTRSQSAGKAFTFTGSVANTPTGYVYLNYIDFGRHYIEDSSRLVNGHFEFAGYISSPVMAGFQGGGANGMVDHPRFSNVFLEPGKMQASFPENDFKHSHFTGSKSQTEYVLYQKQVDALNNKWATVLTAFTAYRNNVDVENNKRIADDGIPRYNAEKIQLSRQFIRQSSQSQVSAFLLHYDMFHLAFDSLKIYFNRLLPVVRTSTEGQVIGEFIRKEESIAIGKPAPDFMQPDSSGAPIWLHDFKGQYVLLDVWASWCVPCREEHPYLRQAYAQFKNKGFIIISLSMDRKEDKQAWLKAIQKDTLTWPQLCDFTVYQNKVVNDYNVLSKGIPANFLINPQGMIVAMNLRGEAVEQKLAALISN